MTCGFAACDRGHRCHHKHRHQERRCKVSSYSNRALLYFLSGSDRPAGKSSAALWQPIAVGRLYGETDRLFSQPVLEDERSRTHEGVCKTLLVGPGSDAAGEPIPFTSSRWRCARKASRTLSTTRGTTSFDSALRYAHTFFIRPSLVNPYLCGLAVIPRALGARCFYVLLASFGRFFGV